MAKGKPKAPITPTHGGKDKGSMADELQNESRRLQELAEKLRVNEQNDADMRANYPYFKEAVHSMLREKALRELPPLPDKDLETIAKEEGAQPLEAFIADIEQLAKRS